MSDSHSYLDTPDVFPFGYSLGTPRDHLITTLAVGSTGRSKDWSDVPVPFSLGMAMDSRELALFVWRDRIGRLTREELLHLAEKGEWPERLRIG